MTLHESTSETILHSGVLFKRRYGSTSFIGRKSWKPRHFELTRTTLKYFTFENGTLRDSIDLTTCRVDSLEIMPADVRKSASSIWRLALNVPRGRRVLMAAPSEREMNVWIRHLGGTLRDLHARPTMEPLENQRAAEKDGDEDTKMQVADKDLASHHRHVAASWKRTTTNFQNFIPQPRRSMIFRRHSLESRASFGPSVFRHSTGQIDDRDLAVELEELRQIASVSSGSDDSAGRVAAVVSGGSSEGGEEMTEQEEDELLRALRTFSVAHSEANENQPNLGGRVDDGEATPRSVRTRASPIFHYCKQECLPATNDELRLEAEAESTTGTDPHVGAVAKDDAVAVNHSEHLRDDPATGKMRRFSTGSMVILDERQGVLAVWNDENTREEPRIAMRHAFAGGSPPSPLAGSKVVDVDAHEADLSGRSSSGSVTIRSSSIEQTPTGSRESLASVEQISLVESSCAPRVSAETNDDTDNRPRDGDRDGEANHRDKWFTRLKSKWCSRREDETIETTRQRTTDAKAHLQLGGRVDDSGLVEPPRDDAVQDSTHTEVSAVLSDMVAKVALLDEERSERFIPLPSPATEGAQAPRVPVETTVGSCHTDHDPRRKKRHFLWRWSAKLRRHRAQRSRRHSIDCEETTPSTSIYEAPQTTTRERGTQSEPVVSDRKSDDPLVVARHFGVTLRPETTSVREMCGGTFGGGEATPGEESGGEEEMIVVDMRHRRRHSVGAEASPVDWQGGRTIEERTNCRSEQTLCSFPLSPKQHSGRRVVLAHTVPAPCVPPRVCAV